MGAGLGGAALASEYLGPVTTRGSFPNFRSNASPVINCTQMNAQSAHFVRDVVTQVKLLEYNGWVNTSSSGIETGSGGAMDYSAAVYDSSMTLLGSLALVTSAAANGALYESPYITLSRPTIIGEKLLIRRWFNYGAGGNPTFLNATSSNYRNTALGDVFQAAASGLSDATLGGTITASHSSAFASQPVAVLGLTRKGTVFLTGDSICAGRGDTADASGDMGILARSIGPSYAYMNTGVPSDQLTWADVGGRYTIRLACSAYCTGIATNYKTNDEAAGRTAPQVQADIITFLGKWSGKPIGWIVSVPRTDAGNTAPIASDAVRIADNSYLLAGVSGLTATWDAEPYLESSSLWASATYTVDGVHPSQTGYLLVPSNNAINTGIYAR